mmetsp:Transcript_19473/g.29179  ORF Transcript_19473/g.29179 Transcript_19473/m.29179 type:complete len:219 (-) Transcript_19473:319-975(-)
MVRFGRSPSTLLRIVLCTSVITSNNAFTVRVPSPASTSAGIWTSSRQLLLKRQSSPSPISDVDSTAGAKADTKISDLTAGSDSVSVSESDSVGKSKDVFENDGLFAWMQPYLDLFGYTEGKTTYYGPGVPVDESKFPSEEEQKKLREKAAEDMMNIGMEERERRRQGGEIAYKAAIAYSLISSIILDDGSFGGHLARFAVIMPLFFAFGYTKSADTGL